MLTAGPAAAFAFAAGVLSILSPCILPILPVALGGAAAAHRFGPAALALGLALSFTAIGLFVAMLGFSAGLSGDTFQTFGAILLVLLGIVLMVPALQARFAAAAGPFGNWAAERTNGFSAAGLPGQFGLGLIFGAVWTPCSGPALGAAALMAANGRNLFQAGAIMLAYGLGAALPLLALGTLSRMTVARWRAGMAKSGGRGKMVLGAVLALFGVLLLTGFNHSIETFLVAHSPGWLLALTTRY